MTKNNLTTPIQYAVCIYELKEIWDYISSYWTTRNEINDLYIKSQIQEYDPKVSKQIIELTKDLLFYINQIQESALNYKEQNVYNQEFEKQAFWNVEQIHTLTKLKDVYYIGGDEAIQEIGKKVENALTLMLDQKPLNKTWHNSRLRRNNPNKTFYWHKEHPTKSQKVRTRKPK